LDTLQRKGKTVSANKRKWEQRSAAFIEGALERMRGGENVKALARELGVARSLLYKWKQRAEGYVPAKKAARVEDPRDRRVRELKKKVGQLEGVIGQKTLELDFFAAALRRIRETRQKRSGSGEMASTQKSASGRNRKAD
jgi:transposase-like protein